MYSNHINIILDSYFNTYFIIDVKISFRFSKSHDVPYHNNLLNILYSKLRNLKLIDIYSILTIICNWIYYYPIYVLIWYAKKLNISMYPRNFKWKEEFNSYVFCPRSCSICTIIQTRSSRIIWKEFKQGVNITQI